MYKADVNNVYYYHPLDRTQELFLTVHQTTDCTKTVNEQAVYLAEMLNRLAGERTAQITRNPLA